MCAVNKSKGIVLQRHRVLFSTPGFHTRGRYVTVAIHYKCLNAHLCEIVAIFHVCMSFAGFFFLHGLAGRGIQGMQQDLLVL